MRGVGLRGWGMGGERYIAIFAFFIMLILYATSAWASKEDMCGTEKVIFQCEVRNGKNLALCSKYTNGVLSGIQYRFERESRKEMIFPADGFGFRGFRFNYYFRYQVSYRDLAFSVGSYKYRVYSNFDGEEKGLVNNSAGVVVSGLADSNSVKVPCEIVYIDKLGEVAPYVACDKDGALGCAK